MLHKLCIQYLKCITDESFPSLSVFLQQSEESDMCPVSVGRRLKKNKNYYWIDVRQAVFSLPCFFCLRHAFRSSQNYFNFSPHLSISISLAFYSVCFGFFFSNTRTASAPSPFNIKCSSCTLLATPKP